MDPFDIFTYESGDGRFPHQRKIAERMFLLVRKLDLKAMHAIIIAKMMACIHFAAD